MWVRHHPWACIKKGISQITRERMTSSGDGHKLIGNEKIKFRIRISRGSYA
jgi:hypothetical protein